MDIIEAVQEKFSPCGRGSDAAPIVSSLMPMLERPLDAAVNRVVENVKICLNSHQDIQAANALSSFLVCSGTAGTGKDAHF